MQRARSDDRKKEEEGAREHHAADGREEEQSRRWAPREIGRCFCLRKDRSRQLIKLILLATFWETDLIPVSTCLRESYGIGQFSLLRRPEEEVVPSSTMKEEIDPLVAEIKVMKPHGFDDIKSSVGVQHDSTKKTAPTISKWITPYRQKEIAEQRVPILTLLNVLFRLWDLHETTSGASRERCPRKALSLHSLQVLLQTDLFAFLRDQANIPFRPQ